MGKGRALDIGTGVLMLARTLHSALAPVVSRELKYSRLQTPAFIVDTTASSFGGSKPGALSSQDGRNLFFNIGRIYYTIVRT